MEEKRLTQWGQLRRTKTKVLMFPALLPKICVLKFIYGSVVCVCVCVYMCVCVCQIEWAVNVLER